ncbi:hypothetical protein AAFC00_004243 [Neodothiora populina]|uniref:Uncharacterized protein n=1 Tax=Neodothiora populina TaxID=2781224 RepID=A0ABR3PJ25_9PEZI
MVGLHVVGHLARRALDGSPEQFQVEQLKKAARLYEDTPGAEVKPAEMIPIVLTIILFIVLYASVRYTLGEVVSTLAMIEQPQSTVTRQTVDADSIEPDAPLDKEEKERLIFEEEVVVKQEPLTRSIRKTIRHLHSVGGFSARWRGLGVSAAYHLAHSLCSNFIASFFHDFAIVQAITYIVSSVLLARIHMTWTHVMISEPSPKPWFRRIVSDAGVWRALILPSAVYATAQMTTIGLPVIAFVTFTSGSGVANYSQMWIGLLASVMVMLGLSLLVLLPASVTLTRIEASFLPEDETTIVPFDRTFGGAKNGSKSLFIEAWRSFDMSSRLRLIVFYVKMAAIQIMIVNVGIHAVMAETWILGMDRLSILAQSGSAQLRLAAMGVDQD